MPDTAQRSSLGRWLLLGAAFLVLCGGWIAWDKNRSAAKQDDVQVYAPAPGSISPTPASPTAAGRETTRRPGKSDTSDDETAQRQMDLWLSDPKVEPAEAARRLWQLASDIRHSETVRTDALANALNLTEDQQLKSEFLPSLSTPGLWNGPLGEALLDDLYNRTDQVKVGAAAALLPNADGEFKDHLREVLRFQLDAEDADDAKLIQLAQKKAAEPEDPAEGQ